MILRSLSSRLGISLAMSLTLVFLLLALLFGSESEALSERTALSRMEHDMESVLAATTISNGEAMLDYSRIDAIYSRPLSGHYFMLDSKSRPIRSRSLWDQNLPSVDPGIHRNIPGPINQQLLMLTRNFNIGSESLTLSVAADMSGLYQDTARYQKRLLLMLAVALISLLLLQAWVVRRTLKPLGSVKRALSQLEQGKTAALELEAPEEITPLVSEVNRLLQVMQERLTRSREATGNLAHALKTPLAIIRQAIDRGEREQLQTEVDHIDRLIERELSRARLAGAAPGGFWPEPDRDLHDLVAMLGRIHDARLNIELAVAAGGHANVDREDMLELIGNLLDNACKWADSTININLAIDEKLLIAIEDDGPGLSQQAWSALLSRGRRSDESKPGHGLGLSIVQEIVKAYHGTIEAERSEALGGLKVSITIPLKNR